MSGPDPVRPKSPGIDLPRFGDDPPAAPLDAALSPAPAALGVLLFVLIAVLAATITVLLVPLRVGTTIAPLSVLLAALTNVMLPVLARRVVDNLLAAIAPVAAWLITVFVLAQGRPERDVLLVGSGTLALVFYAMFGAGVVAAMLTLLRGRPARSAQPPSDRPNAVRRS